MEVSEEVLVSRCQAVRESQRRCATLEAGTQVGFDVRQGGLGRDEEAASLAGGPEPPKHTARTPHVGRRTSHVGRRTPDVGRRT